MSKTCPHCKSSDLDTDPSRGDTVCMNCGSVLEENTIVSEVTIQENADGSSSVVGQFVSTEGIEYVCITYYVIFWPTYLNGFRKLQTIFEWISIWPWKGVQTSNS